MAACEGKWCLLLLWSAQNGKQMDEVSFTAGEICFVDEFARLAVENRSLRLVGR